MPGDNSYTRAQQGAGLGLAVAKRIVSQAGGEIGFDTLGEGVQFFFTLPVSGTASQSAPNGISGGESSQPPPSGLTLLLHATVPGITAGIANLLEPFGNTIVVAPSLADAVERASKSRFDAIIAGANDTDTLAASPGVTAPLIAVLLGGERAPAAIDTLLRWPVEPDALYGALASSVVQDEDGVALANTPERFAAIDAMAFSTLEKSVGVKALVDILQCYIATAEQLTTALGEACAEEKWDEAACLAQDIVGAAGGLGLTAVTQAARLFAQKSRDGEDHHSLRNAAQMVLGEHLRSKQALTHLYPDVA